MTIVEACKRTNYSKPVIYQAIKNGKLKARITQGMSNKKYSITEEDLQEWLAKKR